MKLYGVDEWVDSVCGDVDGAEGEENDGERQCDTVVGREGGRRRR